jgi:protein-tyrosine phosphatase
MREVVSGSLWIGNARDARDVKGLLNVGIQVVIDLAKEEPPVQFPRELVYCRFPLLDGAGNSPTVLKAAIDTTAHFVNSKVPTLVACSGGMSRSPVIAAAALAIAESISPEAAVERVIRAGPCDFSPALHSSVKPFLHDRQ